SPHTNYTHVFLTPFRKRGSRNFQYRERRSINTWKYMAIYGPWRGAASAPNITDTCHLAVWSHILAPASTALWSRGARFCVSTCATLLRLFLKNHKSAPLLVALI